MLGLEFNKIEYLGLLAGSFTVFAGINQIYFMYKRQSADDISYPALIAAMVSTALWVTYHFLKHGGGPFLTTTTTLIGLTIVLLMKLRFDAQKAEQFS